MVAIENLETLKTPKRKYENSTYRIRKDGQDD